MGTQIYAIKPAAFFAEIIAFDMGSQSDEEVPTCPTLEQTPASSKRLIAPGKVPRLTETLMASHPTRSTTMRMSEMGRSVNIAKGKDMGLMEVQLRSVGGMSKQEKDILRRLRMQTC
jgi:hypothetical protein